MTETASRALMRAELPETGRDRSLIAWSVVGGAIDLVYHQPLRVMPLFAVGEPVPLAVPERESRDPLGSS